MNDDNFIEQQDMKGRMIFRSVEFVKEYSLLKGVRGYGRYFSFACDKSRK